MTINTLLENLHFIEFAILYLLIIVALAANQQFSRTTSLIAAVIAVMYGVVDEIHQLFVVGRSFSAADLGKDAAGVIVAWTWIQLTYYKKSIRLNGIRERAINSHKT
ncbi:VanZ family protein [Halobacillus sp. B23F22_1]|uniref:VanZ family protein n=1 Tax=Halobacillus sp. B23F22_1 TaxID=3459514 RepID=UPI00373E14EA